MKYPLLLAFMLVGLIPGAFADHITGGEIYYTYGGLSGSDHRYTVTVKLFMRCSSGREFNNPSVISLFHASGERVRDYSVSISRTQTLSLTNTNACITNPPTVCFQVAYYEFDVVVPASPDGYIITAHVVYRIDGMNNLVPGYDQVGATYTAFIPSRTDVPNGPENNSAQFVGSDLVIMCTGNRISYNFGATDADGDQLRYSFCSAYRSNGISPGDNVTPPVPPPYTSVPYGNGYSGASPLGNNVTIDANTGLITGLAPANGTYVITVCVDEIRNGVVIATQRKDFQVNIASCSIAAATLAEEYRVCGDNSILSIRNLSNSPLINTYDWSLMDEAGQAITTATTSQLTHNFSDTGLYTIKLVINRNDLCSDSTTARARIYPGFVPDFNSAGACINSPIQFTDRSGSIFGIVNNWQWDFGENSVADDLSTTQNPEYLYPSIGSKTIRLIARDNLGCIDTVAKVIDVFDKPPIQLAFRDTLICPPDAFALQASGSGNFSWSPQINITAVNSATPVVNPVMTTTYYVDLNDDGCINTDSVVVRVVDRVSLQAMPDTIVCEGDVVPLWVNSNGLRYSWTPPLALEDAATARPTVIAASTTTYSVRASISGCIAEENISVTAVPYPMAHAGVDTIICFNTVAQLAAETDGDKYAWRPAHGLNDIERLNPIVRPVRTAEYVFSLMLTADVRSLE